MALPFFEPKKMVSVIVARRKGGDTKDVKPEVDAPENEKDMALESACEGIMRALDERSVKGLADAIRAAFQIVDAEPHEEGEDDAADQG